MKKWTERFGYIDAEQGGWFGVVFEVLILSYLIDVFLHAYYTIYFYMYSYQRGEFNFITCPWYTHLGNPCSA